MNQKQYHSLEELPLMMNMTDVAAVLGISRAGAYKLAHDKHFPAFQIGRRIVVSREKFLDWLDQQCEEQKMCVTGNWTCYSAVFVVIVCANRKRRR